MKLTPILLFFSYWISAGASVNSEACDKQLYEQYDTVKLMNKYESEYSLFSSVRQTIGSKLFKTKTEEIKLEGKLAKFLCACAIYKIQDINVKNADPNDEPVLAFSFDRFFQHSTFEKSVLEMCIKPYCGWIPFYRHHFPATFCHLERGYLIAKGLVSEKSGQTEMHDIYVSKVTERYKGIPKYLMKGIFPKVDLEMLQGKITE